MAVETQRSHYEKWFETRRGPRHFNDEAALLAAADAFDTVQRSGKLSSKQLQIVVKGASSKRGLVWQGSADLLERLAVQFPAAADAILQMSQSRHSHVRFNALCSLGKKTSKEVIHAVIRAGLNDKSSRVRWKAADQAHSLRVVELVPELTAALKVEKHAKTRRTLEFELRLLRDGYILEEHGKDQIIVTVSYPEGIGSRYFKRQELKAKGIDAIVAKMRSDRERRG